jgi:hypothetical protein
VPRTRLLACAVALAASQAAADPGYYVVTPYDNAGVRSIDFRYWTFKPDERTEMIWPELGFAYGVNSRWTTELFVSWIGSKQMATQRSSLNWQNDVLLTQGELPLDVALHAQLISDQQRTDRRAVEFGPLLQTDIGRTQLNFNVFFERGLGAAASEPTKLKLQWQVRHRWQPGLDVGLQGFSELGAWNDWSSRCRQSHRAGPALFGTLRFNEQEALQLQAAWLVGDVYAIHGHMFTMRARYDFF